MSQSTYPDIFSNVYICAWIARWDCQVHALLCRTVKLYAQSATAKGVAESFVVRTTDEYGTIICYTRGPRRQPHNVKGPAVEQIEGDKEWWIDGKRHRIDGPAIEYSDGYHEWWMEDKLHRIDGPAIESFFNAHQEWWINNKRHRLDGPAIKTAIGDKVWWVDDKRHRIDGPAVEYADGHREWWLYDKQYKPCGAGTARFGSYIEWWREVVASVIAKNNI